MCPEGVPAFNDVEPFEARGGAGGGKAVVEEGFDGVALGLRVGGFGDQADETAWNDSSGQCNAEPSSLTDKMKCGVMNA